MSIDGRGPSLSKAAEETISALKSKNRRQAELIAVLEGDVDRARAIAIELEQQTAAIEARLQDLQGLYARKHFEDPSEDNAAAVRVVQELDAAIDHITSTVMRDLCDDARENQ